MSKLGHNDPSPRVRMKLCRAERLAQQGRWSDADSRFIAAIALDRSPASRIAFANALAARERYHDALCQFTAALDLATGAGNREALGVVFHNLAAIYRELGDADLARRFQQRALLQLDDCGPPELLGLANDAWLSQRTELASCLVSSCIDPDADHDADSADLEVQATVGVMTGLLEEPRGGIRVLIDIYRQHCSAGAERLAGIDLMNLSLLLSEIGWYQFEISIVRSAIRHFQHAPAPVSVVRARHRLEILERAHSLRNFDPSMN